MKISRKKGINIVSLFDGLGSMRLIADRLNIPVDYYYSSEIDRHAIRARRDNYPNCVELGDVRDVNAFDLDFIDLIVAGSPCQNLSFSGKMEGLLAKEDDKELTIIVDTLELYLSLKKKGFIFKGQSYLFWEFVRVLTDIKTINPNVKFLLENVNMDDQWADIFSKALGVNPVRSCASDLLPQIRPRMFWANWEISPIEKSSAGNSSIKNIMVDESSCYDHVYMTKDRFESLVPSGNKGMGKAKALFHKASRRQGYQVFDINYKVECLDTCQGGGRIPSILIKDDVARHMHPEEFELCQGLPRNYTQGKITEFRKKPISKAQRYKMIGNGWAIDQVEHIAMCLILTGWLKTLGIDHKLTT